MLSQLVLKRLLVCCKAGYLPLTAWKIRDMTTVSLFAILVELMMCNMCD